MKKKTKGTYYTTQDDPRIFKWGKILRKFSLDEIPQLVNIAAGEMSFVGPRPDLPVQISNYYSEEWELRCSVLPGITGLSQVCGRSALTLNQRKYLDLWYVKNSTVLMDLWIILKTIPVLRGKNSV